MNCPSCKVTMVFKNSGSSIIKRGLKGVVGAVIGSVAGPAGIITGGLIGASRKGKSDKFYWECPKCGYFEYTNRDK